MNCQLPATGGADLGIVIAATTITVWVAVDSNSFHPVAFCAVNAPGSSVNQAAASGTWTPAVPTSYDGCSSN